MRNGCIAAKRLAAILAGCMMTALLGGCQDKKVDYMLGTEEAEGGNTGSLTQFAEEDRWVDEWSIPLAEGDVLQLSVDTGIVVPEASSMSVVEVEVTTVDTEYKKQLMSEFFDGGDIYYHDITHRTKAEWEEEIAELEDMIAMEETIRGQQGLGYEDMTAAESWLEYEKEYLQRCRSYHQSAPEDYVPADSVSDCDEFIGYRDDVPYSVHFGMVSEETASYISVECMDKLACVPQSLRGYDGIDIMNTVYHTDTAGNQCTLSVEEARQLADEFIDNIGRAYQVCYQTKDVMWSAYNVIKNENDSLPRRLYEEDVVCGYQFVYGTGVDGVAFAEYGGMRIYNDFDAMIEELWGEAENIPRGGFYDSDDQLSVIVTDAGVVEVTMEYPVTVMKVTGQVELLPLDTVKGIVRNEVTEHADDYDFSQSKYCNSMELLYFRLKDDSQEDRYSYVPAWCLSGKMGESRQHGVLVNAIDGSVIHVADEI